MKPEDILVKSVLLSASSNVPESKTKLKFSAIPFLTDQGATSPATAVSLNEDQIMLLGLNNENLLKDYYIVKTEAGKYYLRQTDLKAVQKRTSIIIYTLVGLMAVGFIILVLLNRR